MLSYSLLALVGAIVTTQQTLRLAGFVWFYFLRSSSVKKYLHGPAPYAIVTGATDGIGKATARELFARGFNLIIHGRNEEKLKKVIEEFKTHGSGDIRYFIADAAQGGHDFAQLLEPFRDLNITLVIHNVGGAMMTGEKMDTFSDTQLVQTVVWNDLFPLLLTRTLLPRLRATAERGPVLVEFVGSMVADAAPPSMAVYAATKGFLSVLTRGLDNEERLWGTPSRVEFAYLTVGSVSSAANPITVSASAPSAADFGKAMVDKMGCGKRHYTPWMVHAIMGWVVRILPERIVDRGVAVMMKRVYADRQKSM